MNRSNAFGRFLSVRPFVASAGLWVTVVCSAVAHGQSDATINLSSPATITSTLCFAPASGQGSDKPPYFVNVESLLGNPDQRRAASPGLLAGAPTFPSIRSVPDWNEGTALKLLDLDPTVFDPTNGSWKEEERQRKRKAKFYEAVKAFLSRDLRQALSLFDEAREGDVRVPPPSLLAARLAGQVDDPDFRTGARRLLDQAAFDDPHAPEPPLEAAARALDDGRLADAVAQLDLCLRNNHESSPARRSSAYRKNLLVRAYALQAEAYRRAEKWDLVEAVAVAWLAVDPEAPRASAVRGEAAYRNDSVSVEGHNAAYRHFDEAYRESVKRAKPGESVEEAPPEMQMARLAARLGHHETAAKWSKQLQEKLPTYAKADPREQLRSGMFLARWWFGRENWAEARQAYDSAMGISTSLPSWVLTAARNDRELRRFAAELAYFEQSPDRIDELTRLFVEMPDDETVAGCLARALAESRLPAERARAPAVARANQAGHPNSASARCTLASILLNAERTADAVEMIKPVLESSPTLAPDDAYLLAKVVMEYRTYDRRIVTVIDLLGRIKQSTGPSLYRTRSKEWLEVLTGT